MSCKLSATYLNQKLDGSDSIAFPATDRRGEAGTKRANQQRHE
jgi:hypothetical protein